VLFGHIFGKRRLSCFLKMSAWLCDEGCTPVQFHILIFIPLQNWRPLMKNPASDVSRLPSPRKRRNGHKTTPLPSPVEVIWNEFCSWIVSQTLRETPEMTQETDLRLLPALLERFWDKDFPCPAPFLQALTVRLMQHGPFQQWRKEDFEVRKRLFSALLRLDAGRGLVLPFVEACLPHENHPEVLAALIESWPPGLVCPETIWQQLCKKTRPPVKAGEHDETQKELRQLAWQALFQLPAPERDPTGSPRWLSFLRQQLKFETSCHVLQSIWSGLNRLGRWPTSAEERTAWLAELERHSPCGSKASDRFVTDDALLCEAIIWRVLFGMQVPAAETDASVLSRELLSRYLSDYLNPPCLADCNDHLRLLKTMATLPAMEGDRRAWLSTWEETWEETGAMTGISSLSREAFWEVMVRAQEAGLCPAEETMKAAIRALGSETNAFVRRMASHWVPPAGRLQKLWSDLWEPYMFDTSSAISEMAWRAWRPAGDGYEKLCSRLMKTPDEFRRTAARHLLSYHRTEMTQERWHAWWAQWVRQESDLLTLEELLRAMQDWQPLPEVIVSAWRERAQGGEPDARVRGCAWWVLASQPVDLSQDIIRHLPCETDPKVLETMAGWSPAATPVPAAFWEEWGKKFATLSSGNRSFLLGPLVTCCLKWRPAKPDQIQEMWTMWEQILRHYPTDEVRDTLKLLSNAPFLAPPASPRLSNLVANKRCKFNKFDDIVERLNLVINGQCELNDIFRIFFTEGEQVKGISSFTGNISNPLWWEQQAEDMISEATEDNYTRTTAYPERENCLRSFQWICDYSPARGRGLLPGWNTLRPVLEDRSLSPEVELFFFSLVRKWGSPEGWQAWWEMAAAREEKEENRDDFVIPGGCCGMIRRVYLAERLAASLSSCGEQADETTLRRLFRQLKQQWWRVEDVKLWQWVGELVEKAVASGEGPGFQQTGSAVLSDRMWPLASGLPAWKSRSTSGQVSDFPPAHPFSPSLS